MKRPWVTVLALLLVVAIVVVALQPSVVHFVTTKVTTLEDPAKRVVFHRRVARWGEAKGRLHGESRLILYDAEPLTLGFELGKIVSARSGNLRLDAAGLAIVGKLPTELSCTLTRQPLSETLEFLGTVSGLAFEMEPTLAEEDPRTTASFQNPTPLAIILCELLGAERRYSLDLDRGVIVVRRAVD